MFQNIADMDAQEENLKTNNTIYRLKQIFRYQNIIIYILTFLMATLSIKGEIVPFGLAMVAACVGETVPLIGVYLSAIIGTYVGNGAAATGNFVGISIVYFLLVLFVKTKIAIDERNESIKSGGKLFSAAMIITIITSYRNTFSLYDVFMGSISASLMYVFYKIFVNGLATIKDFNDKKAFTIEELVASVIIVSIASVALSEVVILGYSLTEILVLFMIMVLGWKHGLLIGAITAISIGLSISFIEGLTLIQVFAFVMAGIISGVLGKIGKLSLIAVLVLINIWLAKTSINNPELVFYIKETMIASLGILLLPKKVKLDLEDLLGKHKLISNNGENRLNGTNDEVSEKLRSISEMFNELVKVQDKDEIIRDENFIQDFLDNVELIKDNIFYDVISDEDTDIARDICKVLKEQDIIVDKDLVNILNNHNNFVILKDENIKNDIQEVIKIANRTLKNEQIKRAKEEERKKNLASINENLKNVTKVIDKCAEEISKSKETIYTKKEQEIELLLKSKGIKIHQSRLKKLKNEKYIIELKLDFNDQRLREKEIETGIADVISKSIGSKMVFQRDRIDEENKEYSQIYASEDKFVLQVGSAKTTKDGSTVSGDCSLQIKLADGKYLVAIADGMGSGEKARECSKITLRLVKQMLSAGFNGEESVKLINSRMNLAQNKEMYSSLDIAILDLYAGKIELLKNGACNTYVKNKKNIKQIKSENLPVGIVDNIELKSTTLEVNDGDIVVMYSDGIVDSKENVGKEWIEDYLKNISTNNVQKIADLILTEAVDNSFGIAHDDMTVIVTKIVKKK